MVDSSSLISRIDGRNTNTFGEDYAGKTPEQRKALRNFLTARNTNRDFVKEYFEKGVRMYRLYAGKLPDEIDGTFSKVMLWYPYMIIDTEMVQYTKSMMYGDDWIRADALFHDYEPTAKTATKWLKYQMEKVQQFQRLSIPTLQSAPIFGNGYRLYNHSFVKRSKTVERPNVGDMGIIDPSNPISRVQETSERGVINGKNIGFFDVLPSPTGSEINPPEGAEELGLDNLIVYTYPTKTEIEGEVKKGNFDKDEADRLFQTGGVSVTDDFSMNYKQDLTNVDGAWNQFQAPEWIRRVNSLSHDLERRFRVAWFWQGSRTDGKWTVVGEDRFILYDGPPKLDFWPLANFKSSFNLDNFFGTSLLEVVEDLIISIILNFNMRLDHLAGKFFPPKYAPQALIDALGGDSSVLDWEPYKVIPYPHSAFPGGLQNMIFSDVSADLDQQAFIEQGQMKEFLEDIISMHGTDGISGNTATVGAGLLNKEIARSMHRAMNVDMTGIRDSALLTLKMGAKYVNEDQMIRTGEEGLPWENIDHRAIIDGYGVEINGANSMMMAEDTFRKQLSVAPMLLGDPEIQNQVEMKRQLLTQANYKNPDLIINGSTQRTPTPRGKGAQMPGGVPSAQNTERSTQLAASDANAGAAGGTRSI
jgi:hypothetical protein